ncbi:MAG: NAD-dependent epimerase [Proteobacteria bacterium]|nr:NAD-dependent epimerase [Pseudomonadota bacterium]
MKVLVTGAAGFVGFHTAKALLNRGDEVVGLDNLNEYYDVRLKRARLDILRGAAGFRFVHLDLADRDRMTELFAAEGFRRVVHLGAQAGVRHSIAKPFPYVQSNILGTLTVLEGCRHMEVEHLVFASTSSVYGANTRTPFSVRQGADHPLSLYAATKKSGEMMAHSYASLYGLPVTGLRFFTVYGPFGRPDMAVFRFTRDILEGRPIGLYNQGNHRRDFTYVDDAVHAVVALLDRPPQRGAGPEGDAPDPSISPAPYRLYNICAGQPQDLSRLVELLETSLGRKAIRNLLPMRPGDVHETWGDIAELEAEIGHRPAITLSDGVKRFVDWYMDFYGDGS